MLTFVMSKMSSSLRPMSNWLWRSISVGPCTGSWQAPVPFRRLEHQKSCEMRRMRVIFVAGGWVVMRYDIASVGPIVTKLARHGMESTLRNHRDTQGRTSMNIPWIMPPGAPRNEGPNKKLTSQDRAEIFLRSHKYSPHGTP